MKKKIILKKEQLVEYVNKKKSEKIFYEILEKLYNNRKYLKESISYNNVNQNIIDDYYKKNLINPMVFEMLTKNKIINENREII